MMKVFLVLISIGWLAACGHQAANVANNQTVKASPSATVNSAPLNNTIAPDTAAPPVNVAVNVPKKGKIQLFDGKGVVTKINLEGISVELKHEEIKGLMPAMQMEFHVKEKAQLEKLNVGDAVDFVLEDNAGAEQIISIKKAK